MKGTILLFFCFICTLKMSMNLNIILNLLILAEFLAVYNIYNLVSCTSNFHSSIMMNIFMVIVMIIEATLGLTLLISFTRSFSSFLTMLNSLKM